jgi:heptosyltransferase II
MERLAARAPNHLGELVLALPALAALAERARRGTGDRLLVQLPAWLLPVLRMSGLDAEPLPFDDRRAVLDAAGALRRAGARRGVLLTPSFSSALIFRLAGLAERRGTAGGGRDLLLTDPVDREPLLRGHRVAEFLAIAGEPLPDGPPPAPRLRSAGEAPAAWARRRKELGLSTEPLPTVGLLPGSNAESRRWPSDRFARVARELAETGARVYVFGSAGESRLTASVAAEAAGRAAGKGDVVDLGGRTSLEELAGALLACHLLVTNDTGPMHLAAALDRPIVALEGAADPAQTRPLASRVRLVGRFDLPCVPCVRNECPRRGRGTVLAEARLECMRLIRPEEVLAVSRALLEESVS